MNHHIRNFDETFHFQLCLLRIKKASFDFRQSNIELLDEKNFKQEGLPVWNFVQTIRYVTVDGQILIFNPGEGAIKR